MLNLSSKSLTIFLGFLFILLQYAMWFNDGGLCQIWKLKQSITEIETQNKELQEKNGTCLVWVHPGPPPHQSNTKKS